MEQAIPPRKRLALARSADILRDCSNLEIFFLSASRAAISYGSPSFMLVVRAVIFPVDTNHSAYLPPRALVVHMSTQRWRSQIIHSPSLRTEVPLQPLKSHFHMVDFVLEGKRTRQWRCELFRSAIPCSQQSATHGLQCRGLFSYYLINGCVMPIQN